jgi:hypothetical protein
MVPIRVKFDGRHESVQLIESYNGPLFEDGEDYCLILDDSDSDVDNDSFDQIYMQ